MLSHSYQLKTIQKSQTGRDMQTVSAIFLNLHSPSCNLCSTTWERLAKALGVIFARLLWSATVEQSFEFISKSLFNNH